MWARSATKHRISRERSRHVIDHASIYFEQEGPVEADRDPRILFIGDDMEGIPLEVMAVNLDDGTLYVIHSMPLRNRHLDQYKEVREWRK
jgi:hypothetical protein